MVIAPVKGKISFKYILSLLILIFFNSAYAINIIEKNDYSPLIFENINIPLSLLNISGIPFTSFHVLNDIQRARSQKQIADLCQRVDLTYKKLNWGKSPCFSVPWKYDYVSENGNPLIYWDFVSDAMDEDKKKNITVVLGGVHPDELTPVHLAFQFAEALQKNPELYANSHVIVAPLVNPDGFFTNPPKRTNANGVDLNRNFPTATWNKYAYQVWLKSKQKDKRKFPGYFANSEQGTRFQADLLEKFHPDKVISIHAPLAFLDLDYEIPQLLSIGKLTDQQKKARNLAELLSRSAGNYKIKYRNIPR